MAKNEKRQDKARAARQARRAAAEGTGGGAAAVAPLDPSYGYMKDGDALVPNPDETETLARIRELAAKSLPIKEIAAKLEAEGKDCRGNEWDHKHLQTILRRKVDRAPNTGDPFRR